MSVCDTQFTDSNANISSIGDNQPISSWDAKYKNPPSYHRLTSNCFLRKKASNCLANAHYSERHYSERQYSERHYSERQYSERHYSDVTIVTVWR